MTREQYNRADDLMKCIWGNEKYKKDVDEDIAYLKRLSSSKKDKDTVVYLDQKPYRVYIEDLIRAAEDRSKHLEELIQKQKTDFENI